MSTVVCRPALICEEDPDFAEHCTDILQKFGLQVWTTSDVGEAIRWAGCFRFSIGILGLEASFRAAVAVAHALQEVTPGLPVVVLSAASEDQRPPARPSPGAVLQRPPEPEPLREALYRLLGMDDADCTEDVFPA
jgi:DNA-binding response OmpR family regulator